MSSRGNFLFPWSFPQFSVSPDKENLYLAHNQTSLYQEISPYLLVSKSFDVIKMEQGNRNWDPKSLNQEFLEKATACEKYVKLPVHPVKTGQARRGFPEMKYHSYGAPLPRLQGGACGALTGQ